MHDVLMLHLQGYSAYRIARKLNLDPPSVYAGLKAAKQNFRLADEMIMDLKARGWPAKLAEVEQQLSNNSRKKQQPTRIIAQGLRKEEIALKLG